MPLAKVADEAAATQQMGLPLQSQIGDPSSWPETWSVQLFRSIDSSSAAGLPTNQDTLKAGLSSRGSSRVVEFGIQVSVQSHLRDACRPTLAALSGPACHALSKFMSPIFNMSSAL